MSREQISKDSCSISTSCHVFRLFGDVCNSAATRPDADVIDDGRGEGCSGRPHANWITKLSQVESGGTTADILSWLLTCHHLTDNLQNKMEKKWNIIELLFLLDSLKQIEGYPPLTLYIFSLPISQAKETWVVCSWISTIRLVPMKSRLPSRWLCLAFASSQLGLPGSF